eukprot:TRINITY_DN1046_c3_g1_i1.p1 TRINITY_DN1046_c3_g1~~TRINITY_DN1046_c3_g1_i1.p1  ORF type:complete len:796 (-),score=168.00 TRINITY_DN1046_c3_g1_i1:808-3195(-)
MARLWLGLSTTLAATAAVLGAFVAAVRASGGENGLHPLPRVLPPICTCDDDEFGLDEGLARCQLASDFLIALSYFSIPLELLYFFVRTKIFPHRWVLLQFGLFIVLCGLTHLVGVYTYGPHAYSVSLALTILKASTAAVSCATAFLLVKIIPALLNIKVRELFLEHKAAQLGLEMGVIKRQQEVGEHVGSLIDEIRTTIDRHTILHTTLRELGHTLDLHQCSIWMPDASGTALELVLELERRPFTTDSPITIPLSDETVQEIIRSENTVTVPPDSPLGLASLPAGLTGCPMAATRLLLLPASEENVESVGSKLYGLLLLVLPSSRRQWKSHEKDLVEAVAYEVALALSHAAELEGSERTRAQLVEQNRELQIARGRAEMAVRSRSDLVAVMSHEMRTPLHSVMALSSILQEEGEVNEEQTPMLDTILRSASLLATMVNDVLECSRLEEGRLVLDARPFELQLMLQEAGKLAWSMAKGKGLEFSLQIADDLPRWVVGDEKRLMQIILTVVGGAVKGTAKGVVSLKVRADWQNTGSPREKRWSSWESPAAERRVSLHLVAKEGESMPSAPTSIDTEAEVNSSTALVPRSHSFGDEMEGGKGSHGPTLGFAICQKMVELMGGRIDFDSTSMGQEVRVALVVQLPPDPLSGRRKEELPSIDDAFRSELAGLRCMVVDDNSVNRLATQDLLETLGCEVVSVASAVECVAELHSAGSLPFDTLFLDLVMPEIDGYDVARRVTEIFRPDERPLIIALTARTDKGMREACAEAGMDAVLLKPVTLRELGNALLELLQSQSRGN